jgi:hypothetical protein
MRERLKIRHGYVRLACNLSLNTAAKFKRTIANQEVSLNEGARQAIWTWEFFRDELDAGNKVAIITPNGDVHTVWFTNNRYPARNEDPD